MNDAVFALAPTRWSTELVTSSGLMMAYSFFNSLPTLDLAYPIVALIQCLIINRHIPTLIPM